MLLRIIAAAQIKFMQKKYDEARPGFTALTQDPNIGDLAAYKVFLCDLLAGHEDAASRELNVFNDAVPIAAALIENDPFCQDES